MIVEERLLELLERRLTGDRYSHSIGVADTGEMMAKRLYEENKLTLLTDKESFIARVRQAGLLHDYAKDIGLDQLRIIAEEARDFCQIDREEMEMAQLLHAPVSAYLARKDLGIEDEEVLEAIRYHTIGSPEMGLIARIIFVADYIEPNRTFKAAEEIREEFKDRGLDRAIIKACDHTINYNIVRGNLIHPNILCLRNACLRRQ